jgi:HlyD family secretion protein
MIANIRRIPLLALAGCSLLLVSACSRTRPAQLKVSGNVEVTQVQASFRVPGRVAERPVDEGQLVKTGQLLARLDDQDLKQQLALRQADEVAARAALDKLLAGSRSQEVGASKAALQQAEADLARAQADDRRNTELLQKEVISQREFDATHSAYLAAEARMKQAREQYDLVKVGPRKEDIEQGRAALAAAAQGTALAQTQLGYATLLAPSDGLVLSKNVEPGDYVAPGTPVVTLGDLGEVFIRAYIDERDLGRVKVGQKAVVGTDSYPGKRYEGLVTFISQEAEFTPKTVQTQKERVALVYRIKVTVPNPSRELKPGMPADVTVDTAS